MPIQSARVSVMDRGFLYGDGVYETVRVYNRRELKDEVGGGSSMLREHFIFRLKDHMKRLETSARGIQLRIPWTNENLSRGLLRVAQAV
jgi:branched-subunit amino acid aminotransferase/4-amino-4-deoxychorismate lyase